MEEVQPREMRVTWHQIAFDLRREITDGALKPRDHFPSVAELGARYDVSARTVRRAYDRLENDGLIERRTGAPVRVSGGPVQARVIANFHKLLADFRYDIANDLLLPGQQLLRRSDLAGIYGVSSDLITKVYDQLEYDGLIERRSLGVFIAGAPIWSEAVHYVIAHIRFAIGRGRLKPGQQLPNQSTMARQLGVAVNTIAKAYSQLTTEGLMETRQGLGSFVCDGPPRMSKAELVQAAIREKIGDGRLPPQSHINIAETAAELGVSRRTVTAACSELAKQRLIVGRPRLGPMVLGSLATTYRDIVEAVRHDIGAGLLKPGDQLPDELGMIAKYGGSDLAVSNACAELRAHGLIETVPSGESFILGHHRRA